MGKGLVAFMFTVGACTWIYTKFQRYSGNNTQQSIIATAIAGAFIFIFSFIILGMIL